MLQKNFRSLLFLSADFAELAKMQIVWQTLSADNAARGYYGWTVCPKYLKLGLPVLECLNKNAIYQWTCICDCPSQDYIQRFAKAGADIITFHVKVIATRWSVFNRLKPVGVKRELVLNKYSRYGN